MLEINNKNISDIKINGKNISEGKINGKIVFSKSQAELQKYVGVSYNSDIIYSQDGITWNKKTEPFVKEHILYANNLYISYSETGNRLFYSTNGINWKYSNIITSPHKICYGNGKFVGASLYKMIYSEDGKIWNTSPSINDGNWGFVAYGNGKFVAVDYQKKTFIYSNDGINWTIPEDFLTNSGYRTIFFLNGYFVAFSKRTMAYSTDGINWTEKNTSTGVLVSMIYDGNNYIGVAGTDVLFYTNDIVNGIWSEKTIVSQADLYSITFNEFENLYLVVDITDTTSNSKIYYSNDFNNWNTINISVPYLTEIACSQTEDYLYFEAEQQNVEITTPLQIKNDATMSYSKDKKNWYDAKTQKEIILENIGDKVYFKGIAPNGILQNQFQQGFKITGETKCGGSIMSLIDGKGLQKTMPQVNNAIGALFYSCDITTSPKLTAQILYSDCYANLFRSCTKLREIKLYYKGNFGSQYFTSWVYGVVGEGVLYYNGEDTTRGIDGIPNNWEVRTF